MVGFGATMFLISKPQVEGVKLRVHIADMVQERRARHE